MLPAVPKKLFGRSFCQDSSGHLKFSEGWIMWRRCKQLRVIKGVIVKKHESLKGVI
jgi:hypothetical protein